MAVNTYIDTPSSLRHLFAQNIIANAPSTPFNLSATYLAEQITEVTYESQIAGPDLLTLTMIDDSWAIQTSGICDIDSDGFLPMVDINYPEGTDVWWRLCMVQGLGGDLSTPSLQLTFQHRLISYLQEDFGPLKVASGTTTQAQFIKQLADRIPNQIKGRTPNVIGPGTLASQAITFICPQLKTVQPIAKVAKTTDAGNAKAQLNKSGGIGYGANLKVKGATAGRPQIDVMNALCRGCVQANATTLVMTACIISGIGESDMSMTDPLGFGSISAAQAEGLFTPDAAGASQMAVDYCKGNFVVGGSGWTYGAIAYANGTAPAYTPSPLVAGELGSYNGQPQTDPYAIALFNQHLGLPYDQQTGSISRAALVAEATAIVSAFGGGSDGSGSSGGTSSNTSDVGQLARGTSDNPDEDGWTCMNRLASQVNWLVFPATFAGGAWGNYLYYITGPKLDAQLPAGHLVRSDNNPGTWDLLASTSKEVMTASNVLNQQPSYTLDLSAFTYQTTKKRRGKVQRKTRIAIPQSPTQIQVQAVIDPFTLNAGEVLDIQNSGGINGPWIVSDNTRNLIQDPFSTVTLAPPSAPTAQPSATTSSSSSGSSANFSGSTLDKVVQAAQKAHGFGSGLASTKYAYEQERPFPVKNLFGSGRIGMDCSAFCVMCYYAAGAPTDPSGNNYSGDGNSDSIAAFCKQIGAADAQPGDLVVFPDHVVIYLGNGMAMSQGGTGASFVPVYGPTIETVSVEISSHGGLTGYFRAPGV